MYGTDKTTEVGTAWTCGHHTGCARSPDADAASKGLKRHAAADWGDVEKEDQRLNDEALRVGERLLSVYSDCKGTKFWIITEWDRSVTTVLLPDEY